jgi:hypothetical protein
VTFQYSTDAGLAAATTTASQNIGSGFSAVPVSQAVSGLLPGTTYYFRTVATSAGGTTQGSILSFETCSLVSHDASYTRAPGLSPKIKVSDIASDTHGYALTVSSLGPSVQSATLSTDNTYISYIGANNNNDSFPYIVDNGQVTTATGIITVQVARAGTATSISSSGGAVTIKFAGIPYFDYDVERATSVDGPWELKDTIPAPRNGQFTYTDSSPPQPTAHYRSIQH